MPAIIVGSAAIATQAEIRRMSEFCRTATSFCSTPTCARCALEDVGEQPVVGLDVVAHRLEVVGDVAEQEPQLALGQRRLRTRATSASRGATIGATARLASSTSRLSR